VVLDLVGEVGDQMGSLCQVGPPARMATERFWNAREPRQRTWVGRRQLWESAVEDGGHVACGSEVATGGRYQQVAEWVLPNGIQPRCSIMLTSTSFVSGHPTAGICGQVANCICRFSHDWATAPIVPGCRPRRVRTLGYRLPGGPLSKLRSHEVDDLLLVQIGEGRCELNRAGGHRRVP
jgi:hypothetical protein